MDVRIVVNASKHQRHYVVQVIARFCKIVLAVHASALLSNHECFPDVTIKSDLCQLVQNFDANIELGDILTHTPDLVACLCSHFFFRFSISALMSSRHPTLKTV